MILDEVHISTSNRTAVTFRIGDNDAAGTNSFPQEVTVCLRETSFCGVNPQNPQACIWAHPERTETLFPLPVFYPRHHPEGEQTEIRCNSLNFGGEMALSIQVPLVPGENTCICSSPYRITKPPSWQNRRSAGRKQAITGSSLRINVGRAQIRTTGLAFTKAGRDASRRRSRPIPKGRSWSFDSVVGTTRSVTTLGSFQPVDDTC